MPGQKDPTAVGCEEGIVRRCCHECGKRLIAEKRGSVRSRRVVEEILTRTLMPQRRQPDATTRRFFLTSSGPLAAFGQYDLGDHPGGQRDTEQSDDEVIQIAQDGKRIK